MEEKYYFISRSRDYADEFDTHGCGVMTQAEYTKAKEITDETLDKFFNRQKVSDLTEEEFNKVKAQYPFSSEYFHNELGEKFRYKYLSDLNYCHYLEHKEAVEKKIRQCSRELEVGFGTNESHEYRSIEDYYSDLIVKEIDSTEYEVLKKFFPRKFGILQFPLSH